MRLKIETAEKASGQAAIAAARVQDARDRLAKALQGETPAVSLADDLHALARAEGRSEVAAIIQGHLEGGADVETTKGYLLSLALQGADDTWSGRANDTRRARYDGFREAVKEVVRGF